MTYYCWKCEDDMRWDEPGDREDMPVFEVEAPNIARAGALYVKRVNLGDPYPLKGEVAFLVSETNPREGPFIWPFICHGAFFRYWESKDALTYQWGADGPKTTTPVTGGGVTDAL